MTESGLHARRQENSTCETRGRPETVRDTIRTKFMVEHTALVDALLDLDERQRESWAHFAQAQGRLLRLLRLACRIIEAAEHVIWCMKY